MNTYFEQNFQEQFRNFIDYPYDNASGPRRMRKPNMPPQKRTLPANIQRRGFCGCAATGDEEEAQDLPKVSNEVSKLQAWLYLRSALMIVGAYVVVTWAYKKFAK